MRDFITAVALWLGAASALAAPARPVSPCDLHYPSDARLEWTCHRLRAGETLDKLFPEHWQDVARFNRIDRRHAYAGVRIRIPARIQEIADFTPLSAHLAEADNEAKFVLIDLSEQFLGAYEYGRLVFSAPVTSGEAEGSGNLTPTGRFTISAAQRLRESTLYTIEGTDIPYPMTYALRFHVTRRGVIYWIHGRDVPGYPASHGCVGLYDEEMQKQYYGIPRNPVLDDARKLYTWVLGPQRENAASLMLLDGPPLLIVGHPPVRKAR